LPQGNFKFADSDDIIYSNGKGEYCRWIDYEMWLAFGADSGFTNHHGSVGDFGMTGGGYCRGPSNPTNEQLLKAAKQHEVRNITWHKVWVEYRDGEESLIGDSVVSNETNDNMQYKFISSQAEAFARQVEKSFSFSFEYGYAGAKIAASIQQNFQETWTATATKTQEYWMILKPGQKGGFFLKPRIIRRMASNIEVWYDGDKWIGGEPGQGGHKQWFLKDLVFEGYDPRSPYELIGRIL
jgi:hypothetical protein